LRAEFLLFAVMLGIVFLFQRRPKETAVLVAALLVCSSSWVVRNQEVFHALVPTTTSVGLNLYRGNNPLEIGSWGDQQIVAEIGRLPRDAAFETQVNNIYLDHAVKFMMENPGKVVILWFEKISDLWLVNLHDPTGRSSNPLLMILSLLLFGGFLGGVVSSWSLGRHLYSFLFFGYSTFIAMVFFVLPRYQTMMRIAMLPFAGYGFEVLISQVQSFFKARNLTRL
jgi:hypothetical protein